MRILVLTDRPPSPEGHTTGDQLVYHRLRLLAQEHDITFAYVNWHNEPAAVTSPIHPYKLVALPVPPRPTKLPPSPTKMLPRLREAWGHTFFERAPYFINGRRQPELQTALRNLLQESKPDAIHTVGLLMLYELPDVSLPVVAELVDMWSRAHWQRSNLLTKPTHRFQYWVEGRKVERVEREQLRRARVAVTVSELEKETAQKLASHLDIHIIPPSVDMEYFLPAPELTQEATLLYTGAMSYEPNVEAMHYFRREIFPLVQQAVPEVSLVIAGRDPVPSIQALASESISVTGAVADVRPYFARAAVAIVPLLHGGGVRNKIIEAWAMEKAIVSTHFGAEGLAGKHNQHYLLADNPTEFAASIITLLNNPERRAQLGRNGRQLAMKRYSLLGAARCMNEIYVGARRTPAKGLLTH